MRSRLFGDAPRFRAKGGGYVPLPWLFRRLQRLFRPREWQVFCYVLMRADRWGLCWPTDREIAADLGVNYRKIGPNLRVLAELGFLRICTERDRRYLCIIDPLTVVRTLAKNGVLTEKLPPEQLAELEKDLGFLRETPLQLSPLQQEIHGDAL